MKKKLMYLTIILIVVLFVFIPKTFATTDANGSEIVELPEEVRKYLCYIYDVNSDGKISEAELNNIEYFDIGNISGEISDFSFLRYFTNLKELIIYNRTIDDLSFLENLTALEKLNLNFCNIEDVSKLSNLVNLKTLYLLNNNISDISCLERLVNLEILCVTNNNISDASVINNFPKLKQFEIINNKLTKIPNISNIEAFNDINTYEQLGYVSMEFSSNQITDISNLSNRVLKNLNLYNNKITDISPIATIENLETLTLSKNSVTDVSCLNQLPKLYLLGVNENNLTNLDLTGFKALTYINADSNNISEISFNGAEKLETLSLNYNNIANISGIENLSNLEWLYLAENKISDISMITQLQNLKFISIVDTEVNPYDEATFHVMCTLEENGKRLILGDYSKFKKTYTTEETEDVKVNGENVTILPVIKETNIIDFIIKEKFPSLKDDNIKVVDKDGKPKSNTEKLGSRNIIKIEDENGNVIAEITVVVPGDITGNGYARMYDAFQILKDTIIPGATLDAIDIKIRDHNGDENVRMYDAFQFLKDSILG